jgi:futalosine hydrolase
MDVLIAAATAFEIEPLRDRLEARYAALEPHQYCRGDLKVSLLITGVGLPQTAYALGRLFARHRFDLAINAGIAGSFKRELPLGEVVEVVSERFADLGVEEADGGFTDVHELALIPAGQTPFADDGWMRNELSSQFAFLPKVNGISVNRVHGSAESIEAIRRRYPADVESMEGAAFFYACLLENIPFLEIRAISNYVEPRDRENWNIPLAIEQLNETLMAMLEGLE